MERTDITHVKEIVNLVMEAGDNVVPTGVGSYSNRAYSASMNDEEMSEMDNFFETAERAAMTLFKNRPLATLDSDLITSDSTHLERIIAQTKKAAEASRFKVAAKAPLTVADKPAAKKLTLGAGEMRIGNTILRRETTA